VSRALLDINVLLALLDADHVDATAPFAALRQANGRILQEGSAANEAKGLYGFDPLLHGSQ